MSEILDKLDDLQVSQARIMTTQEHQSALLEKHSDILERQNEILLRNTITVEEHHKRSTLLETEFKALHARVEDIRRPLSWKTVAKNSTLIIGALSAVGTIIFKLYKFLKGA